MKYFWIRKNGFASVTPVRNKYDKEIQFDFDPSAGPFHCLLSRGSKLGDLISIAGNPCVFSVKAMRILRQHLPDDTHIDHVSIRPCGEAEFAFFRKVDCITAEDLRDFNAQSFIDIANGIANPPKLQEQCLPVAGFFFAKGLGCVCTEATRLVIESNVLAGFEFHPCVTS